MPENLIVDVGELRRFIEWLPPLQRHEAYLVQLMIRSRGLKERFGFKGSDHVVAFKAVHGYLDARVGGVELWRRRLEREVLALGLLARSGLYEYVRYKPGSSDEVDSVYTVPWQLLAVYMHVNPSDIIKAAHRTVSDVVEALAHMAHSRGLEAVKQFFNRPDLRYYANLAASTRTVFHVVDADTRELFWLAQRLFEETFGYTPARIYTARGGHLLIRVGEVEARLYAGPQPREVAQALARYRQLRRARGLGQKAREELNALREYLHRAAEQEPGIPYYHRIRILQELYTGDDGVPLIEVKKQALEPVPGMLYKGEVVVRFKPEER